MLSSVCCTVGPLRMIGVMGPAIVAANVTARGGSAAVASSSASGTARLPAATAAAAAARGGRVVGSASAITTTTANNSLSARAALGRRSKRHAVLHTNRRAFPASVTTTPRAVASGAFGEKGPSSIKLTGDAPPRPFFDSKEANDVSGYVNFQSREELKEAAMVDRHDILTPPLSQTYQQTLRRSFTLLGIGLHSGEVESVRVCPAFAGEGRYFVRVPAGTIPPAAAEDEEGGSFSRQGLSSEEVEDMVLEQLRSMMSNTDESSDGTAERAAELKKKQEKKQEMPGDFANDGEGEGGSETRIPAALALVQDNLRLATRLQLDGVAPERGFVGTVEHLLSALEASGVDNARIEVEGSGEIPILDGSAYLFCYETSRVGLVPAETRGEGGVGGGAESPAAPRMAWKPTVFRAGTRRGRYATEHVMVCEGDAFIMFNPDAVTKLTYGIDFTYKSKAIGKQWESWTPTEDGAYVDVIARARTFATMPDIMAYFRAGYIRGGTEQCALIANGDRFWNPPMLLPHENARHKLLDLIGDLSLLAAPGMSGVPVGHIVAYKAGHNLHAKFARKMAEVCERGGAEKVPAELWTREIGPLPRSDVEEWGVDKVFPVNEDDRSIPTG